MLRRGDPQMANAPADDNTWIFGYGSLIWGTGPVQTLDRRVPAAQLVLDDELVLHFTKRVSPEHR